MQPFKYVLLLHPVASSLPSSPQALMKLPSHISQSEEVLAFFETKLEDLNPPTEWVTITVYLNHKLSVSISIISFKCTVRYQTHPSRETVCARVCVVQQLGRMPFTHSDPSWSGGFAVSQGWLMDAGWEALCFINNDFWEVTPDPKTNL